MQKKVILDIVFGIVYYICALILFWPSFIIAAFDGVVYYFSHPLFYISYCVLPLALVIVPLIWKFVWKKEFYKSILYSCLVAAACLVFLVGTRWGIAEYFRTFTMQKWGNPEWRYLRYFMVDDMEEKYSFVGETMDEVYGILGSSDEERNAKDAGGERMACYTIMEGFPKTLYYCICFDENDIAVRIEQQMWD